MKKVEDMTFKEKLELAKSMEGKTIPKRYITKSHFLSFGEEAKIEKVSVTTDEDSSYSVTQIVKKNGIAIVISSSIFAVPFEGIDWDTYNKETFRKAFEVRGVSVIMTADNIEICGKIDYKDVPELCSEIKRRISQEGL